MGAAELSDDERTKGISPSKRYWVPFAKGEGLGEYWRPPSIAIDWSGQSVAELERRASLRAGTAAKDLHPESQLVLQGGADVLGDRERAHLRAPSLEGLRLRPQGQRDLRGAWEHIGALPPDIGYIEKLPYRRPTPETERAVVQQVERIITALKEDPEADIQTWRDEIDERIFDLFEIRVARDEVRRFYETVGRAERTGEEVEEVVAQAASE